jgi:hypothetical protein
VPHEPDLLARPRLRRADRHVDWLADTALDPQRRLVRVVAVRRANYEDVDVVRCRAFDALHPFGPRSKDVQLIDPIDVPELLLDNDRDAEVPLDQLSERRVGRRRAVGPTEPNVADRCAGEHRPASDSGRSA